MGSGKNGTFDKTPDVRQWAVLGVHKTTGFHENKNIYGSFIHNWWNRFNCEVYTMILDPAEAHGSWDGRKVFGDLPRGISHEGRMATLTRATIRFSRLRNFWSNVAPVARRMADAKGLLLSVGIGEVPWFKQATFSVWQDKESMMDFAYHMKEHAEVIRKTRDEKWYSEELFARFRIIETRGTLKGIDPLTGKS